MSARVEPFTIAAYEEVLALWRQSEGVGLSGADSRAGIAAYLKRNPGMSFIAIEDREAALVPERVVGAILCGHDGRRGYIHHLAVHPCFRRAGIARRLLEQALSTLKGVGIQKCHLFVMNDNPEGLAFWRHMGWSARADIGLLSRDLE